MPIRVEKRLRREARHKGLRGKRYKAYIYGTLSRIRKRRKGKR